MNREDQGYHVQPWGQLCEDSEGGGENTPGGESKDLRGVLAATEVDFGYR